MATVSDAFKKEVQNKAQQLVDEVLKPRHVEAPPEDAQFNYITDISTKWYRDYFYFCSTYACPGPNAIEPSFESKFVRIHCVGKDRFNLAFLRHTEQWAEVFTGLTLDEALEMIRDNDLFHP